MDMIERGCSNIICAQPFACLPNHVIGKGMFRALRQKYEKANIVGIDYDPGASEVNQLNRIKLMISTAFLLHDDGSAEVDFSVADGLDFDNAGDFDPSELGVGASCGCGSSSAGSSTGGCGCGSNAGGCGCGGASGSLCGVGASSAGSTGGQTLLGIPALRS